MPRGEAPPNAAPAAPSADAAAAAGDAFAAARVQNAPAAADAAARQFVRRRAAAPELRGAAAALWQRELARPKRPPMQRRTLHLSIGITAVATMLKRNSFFLALGV